MTPSTPTIGTVVVSLMGHDKGRKYLVIKILDAEFVLVADGKYRTMAKPKKKRFKHLKIEPLSISQKLLTKILDETLKDNEIHKHLLSLAKETTPCPNPTILKPKA